MKPVDSLWQGLRRLGRAAGWEVIYRAYLAYYLLRDPSVPAGDKYAIGAAIGYILTPLDIVPDFIVGVGYADDLAVLAGLLAQLERFVTPEIRKLAESAARAVFPPE